MRFRMAALALAAIVLGAVRPAAAQAPAPSLGPQLQDATIVGRGSTLLIKRLPVRTATGTVYRDITIQLRTDASGAIRLKQTSGASRAVQPGQTVAAHDVTVSGIVETETAPEVAAPFTPGLYRQDNGGGLMRLVDMGKEIGTGFPTYSLTSFTGEAAFGSASWYSGPIRTNPRRGLIARAGVTSDAYSYGTVDSSGGGHFDQGMLIGAVEKGKTLTIVSFHKRGCCTYSDTPTGAITYTLVGH